MAFYGGSLVEIATATPRNDNVGRRGGWIGNGIPLAILRWSGLRIE